MRKTGDAGECVGEDTTRNGIGEEKYMREAVIVSGVRTPLGSFNGSLSSIGATKLGGIVIEEAVRRAGNRQGIGK